MKNDEIAARLNELIAEGDAVLQTKHYVSISNFRREVIDSALFTKWRVNSLSFLQQSLQQDSIHYTEYNRVCNNANIHECTLGLAVLKAALEERARRLVPDASPVLPDSANPIDSVEEGINMLEEVLIQLSSNNFDIQSMFRKCSHALRILNIDEEWIKYEMEGYPSDYNATWRSIIGTVSWVDGNGYSKWHNPEYKVTIQSRLSDIVIKKQKKFSYWLDGQKKVHGIMSRGRFDADVDSAARLLEQISQKLFDYVSSIIVTFKFGQVVSLAFNDYRHEVEKTLIRLGIDDDMKTAYQNLLQNNESSWKAAALACRNIIQKLSDSLIKVNDKIYPYLNDGNDMVITTDKPRNRLGAYLHQKGVHSDSLVVKMIDPLYSMSSEGKSQISYDKAQRVIIYTYILLGEMIKLTDMKPITQLKKI